MGLLILRIGVRGFEFGRYVVWKFVGLWAFFELFNDPGLRFAQVRGINADAPLLHTYCFIGAK